MTFNGLTHLELGLYEELITMRVADRLGELRGEGVVVHEGNVGTDSAAHVLARHVGTVVRRVLDGLPADERVRAANHILESTATLAGARAWVDMVEDGPRQLLALSAAGTGTAPQVRPATPLSESAL